MDLSKIKQNSKGVSIPKNFKGKEGKEKKKDNPI